MLVNTFSVTQSGDIGGNGVSRFHILGDGTAQLTNTQLNAAATAITAFYSALHLLLPSAVLWQLATTSAVQTVETGALVAEQNIPVVPAITAGLSASYPGGTGARVYWHTNQVKNRRLIRGATFIAPLIGTQYANNGALITSCATTIQAAAQAYIAAVTAATLVPVIYARPPKTLPGSGLVGNVVASSVGVKPASLRSRRS